MVLSAVATRCSESSPKRPLSEHPGAGGTPAGRADAAAATAIV